MASMREIKRRRDSIGSTKQITNAMKLVATARLQKAKMGALETRPYFHKIHETIGSIIAQSGNTKHKYLVNRESKKTLYLVISSNRGLAGGYNNNIVKLVTTNEENDASDEVVVYSLGKKAGDLLKSRGYNIEESYNDAIEEPEFSKAVAISNLVLSKYEEGVYDRVYIAYTEFESIISQTPKLLKILPLNSEEFKLEEGAALSKTEFEPSPEEVLDKIIPQYIASVIYGGLMESRASEQGARQTAMDSATKNADEMISKLTLQYNRARQAAITQELSEIVAGAEALR